MIRAWLLLFGLLLLKTIHADPGVMLFDNGGKLMFGQSSSISHDESTNTIRVSPNMQAPDVTVGVLS